MILAIVLSFIGGVGITILIFLIALNTSKWMLMLLVKEINSRLTKEINSTTEKAKKEIREAFGVKTSGDDE